MIKIALMGTRADGTPDPNTRYWIAGDPLKTNAQHSALDVDQRTITRQSQDETGALWDFRNPHDRGNEKLTMSFSTTLTFDSLVEAWRWRNSFSSVTRANWPHPLKSDAIMRFENTDGSFEDVRLYNVLLSKPTMNGRGVAVECSYQLAGGRIETMATGESAIPMADAYAYDSPMVGLFLTSVGGTPLLDDADTWSSSLEANNGWWLQVSAADVRSSPSGKVHNFYFGIAGAGLASGLSNPIDLLPPMKDRLAAIGAALDPTWFSYTIETVGGRSMLRIKNIRSTDYVGTAYPPVLDVYVYTWTPQSQNQVGYVHSVGSTSLFTDVLPLDDAGDLPVGDDDVG